ncbi:MAG TPA: glycosyltransferase family 39 protein, partial [Anaerolineae bacterium]|nr:glycosyltransferase family 39 protein [Anaerolineae bacterium]
MNRLMTRRLHSSHWLLLGLTWLAFTLRVAGITAQSLWRDEVDALIFATRPLSELLGMFHQTGQNGPLFFLALRPWLAAVGQSEFALRFPSALAGALAVPIFYALMRRLVQDRKPAAIAALLMATAPYLIWYGQEAKMYAALTVLVPASLLLTVEVSRRGGWWRWALLYVITSLCFYTHLLAALIVPVQALWLLILSTAPSRRLRRWLAVGLYLAALILPYLPLLRWQAPTW